MRKFPKARILVLKRFPHAVYFLILTAFSVIAFTLCSVLSSVLQDFSGYDEFQPIADDFISEFQADDPRLVDHLRKYYLFPPTSRSDPYNLQVPDKRDWSQKGQTQVLADIFRGRKNGFFIEAGAYDGETYSNSLYFEKYLNWTGLLVEPDPDNFRHLTKKCRKAWSLRGCLHGEKRPRKMRLRGASEIGTLENYATWYFKITSRLWRSVRVTEVWCFPLESILIAIDDQKIKVDLVILDLEGIIYKLRHT